MQPTGPRNPGFLQKRRHVVVSGPRPHIGGSERSHDTASFSARGVGRGSFFEHLPSFPPLRRSIPAERADRAALHVLGLPLVFAEVSARSCRIASALLGFQNGSVPLTRRLNGLTSDSTNPEQIGNPA